VDPVRDEAGVFPVHEGEPGAGWRHEITPASQACRRCSAMTSSSSAWVRQRDLRA
jgi:hypothetical protein